MPSIGLSGMYIANYKNNGGVVSYSNGRKYGRAVALDVEAESSDANKFRADNTDAEMVTGIFTGGTVSAETAELSKDVTMQILGVSMREFDVEGVKISELAYDEQMQAATLGYGWIVKKMVHGIILWDAYVLKKIAFKIPANSFSTQGEEIEWGTATIEGVIMRDDTSSHEWQTQACDLESEELADKYIRAKLGIGSGVMGEIVVTSVAGSEMGKTKLTVLPTLEIGNKYMLQSGASVALPFFEQEIKTDDGFIEWDGLADVEVSSGDKVIVIEVDSRGLAKKAGITTAIIAETRSLKK